MGSHVSGFTRIIDIGYMLGISLDTNPMAPNVLSVLAANKENNTHYNNVHIRINTTLTMVAAVQIGGKYGRGPNKRIKITDVTGSKLYCPI